MPGTTRDTVDTSVMYKGQPLLLIDTAGIRRRGRVEPGVEKFSVLRAFQAIQRSNVAILVVDASELLIAQDSHIAGYVAESYRGLIIAVNKWDLVEGRGTTTSAVTNQVRRRLSWASYAPIRFISATTGAGVRGLVDTAMEVYRSARSMSGRASWAGCWLKGWLELRHRPSGGGTCASTRRSRRPSTHRRSPCT